MPDGHAAEIRTWLSRNGFRKLKLPKREPEHWFRGDCGVRFTRIEDRYEIAVLHVTDSRGWVNLGELLGQPVDWNRAVALVTELVGTAGLQRAPGKWLYARAKPWAHAVKVILQMLVGAGAVADITWHVARSISRHKGASPFAPPVKTSVSVIASALAVAAAIELAYTLFTPGPDEALDPLMLGLSSGILVLITKDAHLSPTVQSAAVLLGVLALGALFLIRRHLLSDDE